MRYKFIELVGYIGFYNGMALNQINIDFTKCKHNKILIRGKNGSGKSTLLNAINPNPDSNDCFIPKVEARKTICIVDTNTEYLIRYIHPVNKNGERQTTKGYISRIVNGSSVELNPSGNISSCKDILYEEFNLDSNYVGLSKISSENRGIVDSRPADRKKLLNNIINILDTYNAIYKNISKKVAVYKTSIDSLIYKIDSIGSADNLVSQITSLDKQIESLSTTKDGIIEAIAAIKIKINEYNQILIDNKYDDVLSEMRSLEKDLEVLQKKIDTSMANYKIKSIDKIDEFLRYIDNTITKKKADAEHLSTAVPTMLAEREVEVRELQQKTVKLQTLQGECNYKELKENIQKNEQEIAKYEEILSKIGGNVMNITRVEYDEAMQACSDLLKEAREMLTHYDMDDVKFVVENLGGPIDHYVKTAKRLQKQVTKMLEERNALLVEIEKYKAKRQTATILKDRPKDCHIDSCPYIVKAIDAQENYPESVLKEMINRSDELKEQMDIAHKTINNAELYFYIGIRIKQVTRVLDTKMTYMLNLPIRRDFKETFFVRLVNLDPFDDIAELVKYVDCANFVDEYNNAKQQHEIYMNEYKVYESKNELIESIIQDIDNLNNKLNEIDKTIQTNTEDVAKLNTEIANLENARSSIKELADIVNDRYKPSKDRYEELKEIKDALDYNTRIIEGLNNDLSKSNVTLGEVSNDIKRLSEERENCTHHIKLLNEYRQDLERYQSKYVKLNKIRYYSSPSTGIQTLFMEIYMNKIIITANELLSMLFNGEFSLRPFVVNESEFRIPCVGDGLMHDDISSMSTAQKSMISMILSFAILYQSSTKYNVISVDEIDGGLDTNNRAYFTSLLDKLMGLLNCEQCFIISHNDELNTSSADLILLKNDVDYSYQGNVIWKY